VLPKSCILSDSLLVVGLPSASGRGYEGTFDGSKVRVLRTRSYPEGDLQKVKEVRFRRHVFPVSQAQTKPQTFHQVVAMWKHLAHRNIVPLLGVTIDPIQLVSDWTSDEDLTGYIANHPDADRLSLVCFLSTVLRGVLTLSPAI
jgi:hypothetical protein